MRVELTLKENRISPISLDPQDNSADERRKQIQPIESDSEKLRMSRGMRMADEFDDLFDDLVDALQDAVCEEMTKQGGRDHSEPKDEARNL